MLKHSEMLPADLDALAPAWIGTLLSQVRPGTIVERVRLLSRTEGTASRCALELDYASGCDNGLPARMFLKALLGAPVAPHSMYRCEYDFYRLMRPELTLETPRIYASHLDPQSGRFALLVEDVRANGARMGAATRAHTGEEAASVVESLAGLHATYWNSSRHMSDVAWIETHLEGGNTDYFRMRGPAMSSEMFEAEPYKAAILRPDAGIFTTQRLWEALWALQLVNATDVPTVLHGDPHVENTYILPGGDVGLLDWQLMRFGCWAHDVSYALVTALSIEDRRACEKDLLRHYLGTMAAKGIAMPDWEAAWTRYCQNMIWGVVMWHATPVGLYDEERLSILLDRCRVAVGDLGSFAKLGCGL